MQLHAVTAILTSINVLILFHFCFPCDSIRDQDCDFYFKIMLCHMICPLKLENVNLAKTRVWMIICKQENFFKTTKFAVNNFDTCVKVLRAKLLISDRSLHVQFGNQYTFLGVHANYLKWREMVYLCLKHKKEIQDCKKISIQKWQLNTKCIQQSETSKETNFSKFHCKCANIQYYHAGAENTARSRSDNCFSLTCLVVKGMLFLM